MQNMTLKLLNDLLGDISETNTDNFDTFIEIMADTDSSLEEGHIDSIIEYIVEYLSIDSDSELYDISEYEKKDLVEFIKNIEY